MSDSVFYWVGVVWCVTAGYMALIVVLGLAGNVFSHRCKAVYGLREIITAMEMKAEADARAVRNCGQTET